MTLSKRHQHHIWLIIITGVILLVVIILATNQALEQISLKSPVFWGVTFTPHYAQALGLDPQKTYSFLLQDLGVKRVRLSAYWNEIEREKDQFDFTSLNYYVKGAAQHQAQVVLAIGLKLPRWPECRVPQWLDTKNTQLLQERQLIMLKKVVGNFEKDPTIQVWQIENEPLLSSFGICPKVSREFLKKEVELVKSLTKKPVILTDSGELGWWITPMRLSNIFGTTLYRRVLDQWIGYLDYPLPPSFYRIKSDLVRRLFAPHNQKTILTELQAEPWSKDFIKDTPLKEQVKNFSVENLTKNVEYAQKTGFDEIYLWGVEWWYFMKEEGYPEYWEVSRKLWK